MMTDSIDSTTLLTIRTLTVKIQPASPDPRILLSTAAIIKKGGVVACPTETFYGFSADPFNAEAAARLQELKARSVPRPMILLLSHAESAYDVAYLSGVTKTWYEILSRSFWPGPLTLVLPLKPRVNCPALAGRSTVAVRVSPHPVASAVVRTVGRPITSTSANLEGDAPVRSAAEIDPRLAHRLGLILDAGPTPGGPPSTILDLASPRPTLLRQGAVPAEAIRAVLGFAPKERSAA
ncbi:MAG: L-threonylcarbamoyladenylate synthase [Acidobacteriota bacterium]